MLDSLSFEQVMIAILHDNLEDINFHSYDMLKKLFGRKIAQ
jgi:(p)ppGpp synthase/HD superfamily hydrolase